MGSEWPFEDQRRNPLARARHVAGMYRAALGLVASDRMADLDTLLEKYGEVWMLERPEVYEDNDWLTPSQAAEVLGINIGALQKRRQRNIIPALETPDGWRYRYADIKHCKQGAHAR